MPDRPTAPPRQEAARLEIDQAFMTAFCQVLQGSSLPPMTVLAYAAQAVGEIYRQIAQAHGVDGACTCGWMPSPQNDLRLLQDLLARAALGALDRAEEARRDLRLVAPAGRA